MPFTRRFLSAQEKAAAAHLSPLHQEGTSVLGAYLENASELENKLL